MIKEYCNVLKKLTSIRKNSTTFVINVELSVFIVSIGICCVSKAIQYFFYDYKDGLSNVFCLSILK